MATDPLAQLEAQREHFASDEHVREEVRIWADTSPDERLRELAAISASNDTMLARLDDARLERMRRLRAVTPEVEAILARIRRASR